MSTGAWIFASAVAVAIIGSGAYAVSNSIVAIGNPGNTTTAVVTPTHQLQTVMIAPANMVHAVVAASPGVCHVVYAPPAGKAIVVTQITYDLGTGTSGESRAALTDAACDTAYDYVDTSQAYETQTRTFPTGLPMPGVGLSVFVGTTPVTVAVTGYLIPASQLPQEVPKG
jgi:hypothetical protein